MAVLPPASGVPPTKATSGLVLAAGRYQLISTLGSGGFGRVWLARDHQLNVNVAIKEVYVPPGSTPGETAERVERAAWEARHAAQLRDHPNVVTVHDVVVERSVPWTVMQYIAGHSLADEIRQNGPVEKELGERVALAMLAALGACHQADIMHRDVKPANIMLAEDGTVMLTDFGIAKQVGQSPMTGQDLVVGSLEYIAPERARGNPATPATDLFSLGVTLYHATEGISPFDRGSGMASLSAVLLDELPAPVRAGKRLARVIEGFTVKDPKRRMTADLAAAVLRGSKDTTAPKPKPKPTVKEPSAAKAAGTPTPKPAGAAAAAKPAALKTSSTKNTSSGGAAVLITLAVLAAMFFNRPIWNYVQDHFLDTAPSTMENIKQGQCFTYSRKSWAPAECGERQPSGTELWQVLRRFDDPTATCSPSSVPGWPTKFIVNYYPGDESHRKFEPQDSSYLLCALRRS
ncbi:serine/threonine-protein kinase [Streptomyces xanthochromogenes]|uniref:serine/threonine-protein kinase n=1 Tax=Streptomyces TaxID=1883 RepID=UPI001369D52E|nr:serine/threonine-protein kinase [Streptomyces sp. SID1034]MYV95232.1 protein kinase [Streptomyces sp. SID1034]